MSKNIKSGKHNTIDEKVTALEVCVEAYLTVTRKQGKVIEQLENDVATLKKNSHPPVFLEADWKDLQKCKGKLGI